MVDVTIPLQCLVQTRSDISSITIEAHTKASLAGYGRFSKLHQRVATNLIRWFARTRFYDPDPGQEKQLEVWYNYGGKLHHVVIDDLQRLRIPLMCTFSLSLSLSLSLSFIPLNNEFSHDQLDMDSARNAKLKSRSMALQQLLLPEPVWSRSPTDCTTMFSDSHRFHHHHRPNRVHDRGVYK